MPSYKAFRWVEHIQNLTFSYQISNKISLIFLCLILGLIFWEFGATWCQKARFWEPLGAQLGSKWRPKSPKWRPKSPKWRQKSQKKHPMRSLFVVLENDLLPRSLSERSWAPFLRIFDGFWPHFRWFFRFLARFWVSIWAIVLHAAQNRRVVWLQNSSKRKCKELAQNCQRFSINVHNFFGIKFCMPFLAVSTSVLQFRI